MEDQVRKLLQLILHLLQQLLGSRATVAVFSMRFMPLYFLLKRWIFWHSIFFMPFFIYCHTFIVSPTLFEFLKMFPSTNNRIHTSYSKEESLSHLVSSWEISASERLVTAEKS